MDLKSDWFDYTRNNKEVEQVLEFVKSLPDKFKLFFDPKYSNFTEYLINNNIDNRVHNLFTESLEEASSKVHNDMLKIERKLKLDKLAHRERNYYILTKKLESIGFTGASLELKAFSLNRIWRELLAEVDGWGRQIIDFTRGRIVKLLRKFFDLLNPILESLFKIFSGVEPLKEFKDVFQSYFGLAEEMGN
jgi:hypothetical protein